MAKRFDNGITSYTFASAEIMVAFPEDEVKCKWCPHLRHSESLERDWCHLNNQLIYSRETIGDRCPLTVMNKVESEELKQ